MPKYIADWDLPLVLTGSDEGREGFGKIEGIDLLQGEVVVLERIKQVCIAALAGAERFDRERGVAGLAAVGE